MASTIQKQPAVPIPSLSPGAKLFWEFELMNEGQSMNYITRVKTATFEQANRFASDMAIGVQRVCPGSAISVEVRRLKNNGEYDTDGECFSIDGEDGQ